MSDMLPLTCRGNNKRPTKTDGMRNLAAAELVDGMIKLGSLIEADREECIRDLLKATRSYVGDGYEIARELERSCHWDCNMQIVEELDEFSSILDRIFNTAEDVWAKENPHDPLFSDGDVVIWRGQQAMVSGVYEYRPQRYKVRQGELKATSYYVVPFEDVSAVAPTETPNV